MTADFAAIDAQAAQSFAKHRMGNSPCRSFRVGRPDSGTYAFSVTWRPGHLFLGGDLDQLTVTHYQALPSLDRSVEWLRGASFDYLMGKTGEKQVYDPEQTALTFAFWANDERLEDLREAREQRGPDRQGVTSRMWSRIRDELLGGGSYRSRAGRAKLIDSMADFLSDGPHVAAELAARLDLSDYYGDHVWTAQHRWQWLALRYWAELMVQQDEIVHRIDDGSGLGGEPLLGGTATR